MVKMISRKIAEFFNKRLNLSPKETSSIDYGLQVVFYLLLEVFSIILVSYLLNIFWPVVISIVIFLILRPFAGGIHMPSYLLCYITSILVFTIIGCLANGLPLTTGFLTGWLILIMGLGLFMIKKYAPADTDVQPIKEPSRRRKLKTISLMIVIGWFLISLAIMFSSDKYYNLIFAGSLGILVELLALHPLAFYVTDKYLPEHD